MRLGSCETTRSVGYVGIPAATHLYLCLYGNDAPKCHTIVLPCAKLQAVTRLSQKRNTQRIIYMMHDGWHSHYLPYLSSGQQAVTGSLAVSLGSRALQSPSRQRFADFSCALIMVSAMSRPLFHCIGERVAFTTAGLSLKCEARGLHSLRLASCLNVFFSTTHEAGGQRWPKLRLVAARHATLSRETGKHGLVHISRRTMSGMRIRTFRFGVWRIPANNHTLLYFLLHMLHGR